MKAYPKALTASIRMALAFGAAAALGNAPALAQQAGGQDTQAPQSSQGQNAASSPKKSRQTLGTVEVTGTHIRAAELATSNPLTIVTAQQIKETGALTLGTVLQKLPQITGAIHTPNQDFGGNSGGTYVGLRGLGASRTLVLIDGQRVQGETNQNTDGPVDLNTIPAAAVERIEVLTDGASAIYGSDAIGGVINIILKSNYDGEQLALNTGISQRGDGQTHGGSFLFGRTGDKGSITAALSYNKFDPIHGSARKFSRDLLYLTTTSGGQQLGVLGAGGTGEPGPYLNVGVIDPDLAAKFGCADVLSTGQGIALKRSAWEAGTSPTVPSDYRCYTTSDNFNINSVLEIVTPQERSNAYLKGVLRLTDHVTASVSYIYNKTRSSAFSSMPFYGTDSVTGVAVSKDSYFNPFGIDFSQDIGNSYDVQLPNNFIASTTTSVNYLLAKLEGDFEFLSHDWNWDLGYNFSHISVTTAESGIPNNLQLQMGAGPSFLNSDGVVQCGTATDPISLSLCTPWDPFNTNAPTSKAFLAKQQFVASNTNYLMQRSYYAGVNGGLIDLPGGTVQAAVGVGYRSIYQNGRNDPGLLIDPDSGTCELGGSCTGQAVNGGFNDKDAYGELYIPILKDMKYVHGLSVTLGDRFTRNGVFGSTNNTKIGVEYRPTTDWLVRGTVSSVFRAPSTEDMFQNPLENGELLTSDPCDFRAPANDKNAPNPNAGNPACVNVPKTGTFLNPETLRFGGVNSYLMGAVRAGFPIKPETGKSFDFGTVYSPPFVKGLTMTVDYWRIYLDDIITIVQAQTELNLCYAGSLQYCPLIVRLANGNSAGDISHILTPTVNLGRLDVKGIDFSANYKLPSTRFGDFTAQIAGTYLIQYKSQTVPGSPMNVVANAAGTMAIEGTAAGSSCPNVNSDGGTCYLPRIRGTGTVNWSLGPWSAMWQLQLLGRYHLSDDPLRIVGIDQYGATVYNNVSVTYDAKRIHTQFSLGVNNLTDRQPPLLFSNRVDEFNTDTDDYDVYGRFYWASATVKF